MRIQYLGSGTEEEIDSRIDKVASAGRLSRTNGKAYEVYEKTRNFEQEKNINIAKRIIDMGHKTIAEHDYISVIVDDVTPIIEHILIGSRLSSFTIKSRREVDFRNNGFYVPDFRDRNGEIHPRNEELKEIYVEHMKYLFSEYGKLVDSGMKLEDARFVLPYSFNSNIIMGMDARSFVELTKYLLYGKVSNISEAKKLGEEFLKIIDEYIPYMSDEIRKNPKNGEDALEFLDNVVDKNECFSIHDDTHLTSYTDNPDDVILASALQQRYQISQEKAFDLLERCSRDDPNFKESLMASIVSKPEQRELEQVTFKYDIPIILAVLTHFQRNRMHSLLIPDFVPLWPLSNYDRPRTLPNGSVEHYDEIYRKNQEMRDYFLEQGVNENDLVYFYQAGNKCNVVTNINGRALTWLSRMRSCNKAQKEIRKVSDKMCADAREVAPIYGKYLGPTCDVFGYCPEGKESCGKVLAKKMEGYNDGKK